MTPADRRPCNVPLLWVGVGDKKPLHILWLEAVVEVALKQGKLTA